ncbi:MAG: hypothetical protein RIG84_05940 [Roseovarius sp.]
MGGAHPRRFCRTIGVAYSGAETAESSLKGLRVYQSVGDDPTEEVTPPQGTKRYWARHALAEWLIDHLRQEQPCIVGIDHAFSFPMRYFEVHGLPPDWNAFLADFRAHWPTHQPHTYVDFIRDGNVGNGTARVGNPRWRRLTEDAQPSAKSVFQFEGQGAIAKATHAGLPWLQHIRRACPGAHFWPFDGWQVPDGASVLAEVHPRLWKGSYEVDGLTPAQQNAFTVASWLRDADMDGRIAAALCPALPPAVAAIGQVEGWILGAEFDPTLLRQSR